MLKNQWNGFKEGNWTEEYRCERFYSKKLYSLLSGNEEFLSDITEKTQILFVRVKSLLKRKLLKE